MRTPLDQLAASSEDFGRTVDERTCEGSLAGGEVKEETDASLEQLGPPPLPHLRLVEEPPHEQRRPEPPRSRPGSEPRVPWPFDEERSDGAHWSPRPIRATVEDMDPPAGCQKAAPALRLRRDESVIADLVAARSWGVNRAANAVSGSIRGAAEALQGCSREALRRFESLPRRAQLTWVAAPYAAVALLVLVLFVGRGLSEEPEPPARAQSRAAFEPAKAETPATDVPLEHPRKPRVASRLAKEVHSLPVDARLFARIGGRFQPLRHRLKTGSLLTIYPTFPAEEGYVLAETESGSVGFLIEARLRAIPADDDGLEKRKKRRKKRRKRMRRRRRRRNRR